MQKRVPLLLFCFIVFYALVHSIRHLPGLLHGVLSWNGETTYTLSIIRIAADMAIAFLFTLFPYLIFYQWYPKKKILLIGTWLVICLTGSLLLDFCWVSFMEYPTRVRLSNYLPQAAFFSTIYALFGTVFYFIRYVQFKERNETESLLQNRQSELSFLHSQINPHFLFNNLNNIYSLVYHKNDQSLQAIASLSEMLRYMLYDTGDLVPLIKEISYIEKYIALQQLRFEEPSDLQIKVTGNLDEVNVPPLMLIPFIENAFKHGDVTAPQWLNVVLSADQQHIHFFCSNKKTAKQKDALGGIGIENVRRRLELLYPEKHRLEVKDDDGLFTIKLELHHGK